MFHPHLVHCGDAYQSQNVRLHYYVLNKRAKLQDSTFYPSLRVMARCDNADTERITKGLVTRNEKSEQKKTDKKRRGSHAREMTKKRLESSHNQEAPIESSLASHRLEVPPEGYFQTSDDWEDADAQWEALGRKCEEEEKTAVVSSTPRHVVLHPSPKSRKPRAVSRPLRTCRTRNNPRYQSSEGSDEDGCYVIYPDEE